MHKYRWGQLLLRESKNPIVAIGCQCTNTSARTLKHTLHFCLQVQETDMTPTCVTYCATVDKPDTIVCKTLYPPGGSKTAKMLAVCASHALAYIRVTQVTITSFKR